MSEQPLTFSWCGKPSNELSREELLRIIEHLSGEVQSFRTPNAIRAAALGRVEMLKRGEA